MKQDELFIEASRRQLRFSTPRGVLATEDLWTLKLTDLDQLAVAISSTIKTEETSFLKNSQSSKKGESTKVKKLQLEILKTIIDIKQTENEAKVAKNRAAKQKEFLTELLQKKRLENLASLSEEEIEKRLADLTTPSEEESKSAS